MDLLSALPRNARRELRLDGRGLDSYPLGKNGGSVRVTSKGQVTIPIEIRHQLDISPETEVEFRVAGDVVEIHKVAGSTRRSKRVLERLLGARYSGPSTQDLMALTRDDA